MHQGLDGDCTLLRAPCGLRNARVLHASRTLHTTQQTRISGGVAEVDVVYPERGVYQLMTVKFKGGALIPWRVEWAYRWVIPANAPLANAPHVPLANGELPVRIEIVGETTTELTTEETQPQAPVEESPK